MDKDYYLALAKVRLERAQELAAELLEKGSYKSAIIFLLCYGKGNKSIVSNRTADNDKQPSGIPFNPFYQYKRHLLRTRPVFHIYPFSQNIPERPCACQQSYFQFHRTSIFLLIRSYIIMQRRKNLIKFFKKIIKTNDFSAAR